MSQDVENPLLTALVQYFDIEELRTLCFELGVDYDSLRGEGETADARELILYLQRRRQLDRLIAVIIQRRPHLADLLRGRLVSDFYLPDGLFADWWTGFRRSPLPVQFILGLGIVALLAIVLLVAWQQVLNVAPRNPWGPDVTPARAEETLILVAAFRGPKTGDLLPEQRVYDALKKLITETRNVSARVELVTRREIASETDAVAWGQAHKARLVFWGWYDASSVQVNLTLPRDVNALPGELPGTPREGENFPKQLNQVLTQQIRSVCLMALGWVAYGQGQYDNAARLWDQAIQEATALSPAQKQELYLDKLLTLRGSAAEESGDLVTAQKFYQQAQQINPENLVAIFNFAYVAYGQGDFATTIVQVQRVIDARPAQPELLAAALKLAGQANARLGNSDAAVQYLLQAASLAPRDIEPLVELSDLYWRQQQWQQAIDLAQQAIKIRPKEPLPYFRLGRAYLHTGKTAEAEQNYQTGIAQAKATGKLSLLDTIQAELNADKATAPELTSTINRILALIQAAKP